MKKSGLLICILLTAVIPQLFAQDKYACFKSEANKKIQLSVYFKKKKAVFIKYKGQKKSIPLIYSTTQQTGEGAGSPSFFWTETYLVKTGKKITGTYIFTNAGAYELQLTYTDNKTRKKTSFSIIESMAGENFSPYRDSPCF
jgi:hypothetical protein